jgi:hypothetical protein
MLIDADMHSPARYTDSLVSAPTLLTCRKHPALTMDQIRKVTNTEESKYDHRHPSIRHPISREFHAVGTTSRAGAHAWTALHLCVMWQIPRLGGRPARRKLLGRYTTRDRGFLHSRSGTNRWMSKDPCNYTSTWGKEPSSVDLPGRT